MLKLLLEQRAAIGKQIVALQKKATDEKRQFTDEEKASFDKMCADFDAFEPRIEEARKQETRAKAIEDKLKATDEQLRSDLIPSPTPAAKGGDGAVATEEHRALAIAGWMRYQMGDDVTDEMRDAAQKTSLRLDRKELKFRLLPTSSFRDLQGQVRRGGANARNIKLPESRTFSTIQGQSGGYLIPPETLLRELEINMLWYGGMRQASDSIRTTSGERMAWPTADDTAQTGVLLSESTKGASVNDPVFGKVYFDAYKFSSSGSGGNGAILIPYELIQDSLFDVPMMLGEMMGIRLGRVTNTYFTTGTGAAQPKGLVTCAALGATAASATAITYLEMLNTEHSVDRAYRYLPGCGWMFHDLTFKAIRQLLDLNNRPIWLPNLTADIGEVAPGRISGYPYFINNDMAQITNSAKVMLFGDLSRYKIRTVGEIRIYRLEERYREFDQDGFVAFLREDGNLLDANTTPVKYYQMHS